MCMCRTNALLLFRIKIAIDFKSLMNVYKKDASEHGSLLAPDIRNGLLQLQFELPLNESQTNTFNNPLSSVDALHTSQTDTSHSKPINLRFSYTKCEERKQHPSIELHSINMALRYRG